jgi:anthranilate phosphoribosyltransferase
MTTATKVSALLDKVMRRENLTIDESADAMALIMTGDATPAQMGALLVGLTMKGERPAEIAGLARTMRGNAVKLSKTYSDVFDTCGTGGDRSGTFNISSAAALVVAAAGVRVAKHGNRSISSRCGSADVFEQLGVDLSATVPVVERSLDSVGIAFFFAPVFHPSMRQAAPVRRELGVRTAFNLLGPLTNPAGARRQLIGVPLPELTELIARALLLLGTERAWVVHGADGIDEMSTTGHTKVSECRDGTVSTFYVHPSDFGLPKATTADLRGGDAKANAEIVRGVLSGARGACRDIVLLNAAAGLFVSGKATSVGEGISLATAAIDSGAARKKLDEMAAASRVQESAANDTGKP